MNQVFLLILFFIFLSGCASGTVRDRTGDTDFQKENQPIRIVRVALVARNKDRLKQGIEAVRSVSDLIETQVGIRLEVINGLIRERGFGTDRIDALNELVQTCETAGLRHGEHFDIAVGISNYSFKDTLSKMSPIPLFVWDGVIDGNVCRCYHVIKTLNLRVLAHEIMHAFVLDFEHDKAGLMAGVRIELIPGVTPWEKDRLYLSPKARASALKYKWRDFSELPEASDAPAALVVSP